MLQANAAIIEDSKVDAEDRGENQLTTCQGFKYPDQETQVQSF